MKAIMITEYGDESVLNYTDVERPAPAPDEVLIKVAAAGVNYADTMMRSGSYLIESALPIILGFEAAGTIEETGENVKDFKVGQRVLASLSEGGYAEYAVAKTSQLFPIPDELAFGEATALLVQGMTALGLLREAKAGQTILVHAAAGGVGSLLVQLAKIAGLKVIGTASSPRKLEKAITLGADFAVNYSESDWTERILQITENKGVDIIAEMVGGETVGENLKVLAVNGTMWVYGAASGEDYKLSVLSLMHKNLVVRGYFLTAETPENRAAFVKELLGRLSEKRLQIEVTEFPLEKAAEAHQAIAERRTTGKVILSVG